MKLLRHSSRRSRRGATAVELVISAVILMMLLGAIGETVMRGTDLYREGMSAATLEGQARRLLDRIACEFADVNRGSILDVSGGGPAVLPALDPAVASGNFTDSISYIRCTGWDDVNDQIGWSPRREIRLEMEIGENDNGLDDNSNGLIDERRVVLVPDADTNPGEAVGLGRWIPELAQGELANGGDDNGNAMVNEAGLAFSHDGLGTLNIRLTLTRLNPDRIPVSFSIQTSVRMRNANAAP